MLTANVRLYGAITTQADGTVALAEEHSFPGVRDADAGREPGTIYAYLDLDPIGPNEDGARQGSSLDLHGTLDDYRALVANLQSFIADNEGEWCLHCGSDTCEHALAHNAAYGRAAQ